MSSYILTLLLAAVAAAVAELLTPRGDGGRIVAHVRMVAGLFLLVALLAPLREGITLLSSALDGSLIEEAFPDGDYAPTDYESLFYENLATSSAAEIEAWTKSTLAAHFSIPADACAVSALCHITSDAQSLTELRISLHGSFAFQDPHPIEAYFREALACPCYVTVG